MAGNELQSCTENVWLFVICKLFMIPRRLPDSGEYLVFHIPDNVLEIGGSQSGDDPENAYYKTIYVGVLCKNNSLNV